MKRRHRVALAAGLALAPAVAEANYIFAAATPVGPGFKMSFLEPATVTTTPAGTRTAWSSEFLLDGTRLRVLEEYDCRTRRIRALELQAIAPGQPMRSLRQPGVLSTFPGEGFAARKHRLVCTGQRDGGQATIASEADMQRVAAEGLAKARGSLGRR